jgi:hypothetical protein
MTVIYKAFDGTNFSTAEQCQAYEKKLKNRIIVNFTCNDILFHYEYYDIGKAKKDIANKIKKATGDTEFKDNPRLNKVEVITIKGRSCLCFTELLEYVPAHYKIKGEELNRLFL